MTFISQPIMAFAAKVDIDSPQAIPVKRNVEKISTSQVAPSLNHSITPNQTIVSYALPDDVQNRLLDSLNLIKADLLQHHHGTALETLRTLESGISNAQSLIVSRFFPETFSNFISTHEDETPLESEDSYGVVFINRYEVTTSNQQIEVTVVNNDPAIREYVEIIKQPRLAKKLEFASIITLEDNYQAIEKFNSELMIAERNIVLNRDTMVNILVRGKNCMEIMSSFTTQIQLKALEAYLQH